MIRFPMAVASIGAASIATISIAALVLVSASSAPAFPAAPRAAATPAAPAAPAPASKLAREGPFWVETVDGVATAAPLEALRVRTFGAVTLSGADGSSVRYTLVKRVKARTEQDAHRILGSFGVHTATEGGTLTLTVGSRDRSASLAGARPSADLTLAAPRGLAEVSIETSGGDVDASDLGSVTAVTGGGRLRIDRIHGKVDARTAGGEIELGSIGGAAHCVSGGGSISAGTIRGGAVFETGGGQIEARDVAGTVRAVTAGGDIRIVRAGASVTANTAGGTIEIGEARGAVAAETLGGSIQVGRAEGVRCETAGGAIRLTDVSGSVRAATAVGSIYAKLARGRMFADSHLATVSGDITVLIPSNFTVTVRAENERVGGVRAIVSDFPAIVVRGEGPLAYAEGMLNGGGPLLKLSGTGGTILIKRQD